jgi:hypothetical protein
MWQNIHPVFEQRRRPNRYRRRNSATWTFVRQHEKLNKCAYAGKLTLHYIGTDCIRKARGITFNRFLLALSVLKMDKCRPLTLHTALCLHIVQCCIDDALKRQIALTTRLCYLLRQQGHTQSENIAKTYLYTQMKPI